MKRENLRTAVLCCALCCVLSILLSGTARAAVLLDGGLTVTRAAAPDWDELSVTEQFTDPEYLDKIAQMLPRSVAVTLSDQTTEEIPGTWKADTAASRWNFTPDADALPAGTTDPGGLLNAVSIKWTVVEYTGNFGVTGASIIGQEAQINLWRYMSGTDQVEIWQIPADGSAAVLRGTQADAGASEDGNRFFYSLPPMTAGDAGEWYGLYYSSGWYRTAWLVGACTLKPETYTVTFRPSGGTMDGPETYQTVFADGAYRLETLPEDPVRTGCRFEGWFTSATGGERVDIAAPFAGNSVLYAQWSRESGSTPSQSTSDGRELRRVETTGAFENMNSGVTPQSIASRYGTRMYGGLYANPDGTFTTVDNNTGRTVKVTNWDRDFHPAGEKELPEELPFFGGFFHGETYNYIVYGQSNTNEDDGREVLRVVKYDQEFNRISAAVVKDCYTIQPFDAGSCRMAESGNHLTIHTCRTRYKTEDGLNHQSQLTITVNTETMTVENSLEKFQPNHVSHSFDQFVLYDGEDQVLLDHGDSYPRTVVLHKGGNPAYQSTDLFSIPGPNGDNFTGVSTGGLEQSEAFYFASINTIRQSAIAYAEDGSFQHTLDSGERDVVLVSCGKYMDAGSVRQDYLTDYYKSGITAGAPYLVRAGEDRFVILWEEFAREDTSSGYKSRGVRYAAFNGNGDFLTDLVLLPEAHLSRYCQPAAAGDRVVWYVDYQGVRTFYEVDLSGDAPAPSAPSIDTASVESGAVTVEASGELPEGASLYACLYGADGNFLRMETAQADAVQVTIPLDTAGGAFVQVFLLDGDLKPLCGAKQADA